MRKLAIIGVLLSLLLIVVYSVTRGDWLHGLLSGITLAMSILPEEYPVVLVVFMAMGAWRISRHRMLARRVPTVEALGSATSALWWVASGTFPFLLLALPLPFLREVFHFGVITPQQFALSAAAGLDSALWFELFKRVCPG